WGRVFRSHEVLCIVKYEPADGKFHQRSDVRANGKPASGHGAGPGRHRGHPALVDILPVKRNSLVDCLVEKCRSLTSFGMTAAWPLKEIRSCREPSTSSCSGSWPWAGITGTASPWRSRRARVTRYSWITDRCIPR